jgi:replicative DNA helicase
MLESSHDPSVLPPLERVLLRFDGTGDDFGMDPLISTGFPSLDLAIGGGVRRGDLIVLGGDDGHGTSSLALGIALRCTPRALLITGEMAEERVFERALAISARVPIQSLRSETLTEEEQARVTMTAPAFREWSPSVDTITHGGTDALFASHDRAPSAPLVVVDGIESLLGRDFDTDDALAGIVRELKRFALERDVAVLALSHLPTLDRTRQDRRPRLGDFGARGAAGVHADLVLGLFREEMYDGELGVTGAAELSILKNRDGDTGYVDLYFSAECLRFQDMAE